jgi:hypothetical protein
MHAPEGVAGGMHLAGPDPQQRPDELRARPPSGGFTPTLGQIPDSSAGPFTEHGHHADNQPQPPDHAALH